MCLPLERAIGEGFYKSINAKRESKEKSCRLPAFIFIRRAPS
jgi:hypothetical protein